MTGGAVEPEAIHESEDLAVPDAEYDLPFFRPIFNDFDA